MNDSCFILYTHSKQNSDRPWASQNWFPKKRFETRCLSRIGKRRWMAAEFNGQVEVVRYVGPHGVSSTNTVIWLKNVAHNHVKEI